MQSIRHGVLVGVAALVCSATAGAAVLPADPTNYRTVIQSLGPGDTMQLAAGDYTAGLDVVGLNGSEALPIVIEGPASGPPAVFLGSLSASRNTIEIVDSSWVVLRNLRIDGRDIDDVFAVSAKDSSSNIVHHITVEGCTIVGHGGNQQTVGISTKTPTWGWVIRRNVITGAGTGMYLGNSNGEEPFIGGLIEHNLIDDPEGYGLQIKHQNSRPAGHPGIPLDDQVTTIRHNVFLKTDRPSGSGDRPNVLVDPFPASGPGANDRYEIYGNLFFYNPRESLLQATGRVSIHDNVFVGTNGAGGDGISLPFHNGPLQLAWVYNNTVWGVGDGIVFGTAATVEDAVIGNLVFADTPISGPIATLADNLTGANTAAATFVANPTTALPGMDFYPVPGQCTGTALDLTPFTADTDHDLDFNGTPKGARLFRGAYSGSGANPGWALAAELKPTTALFADGFESGGTGPWSSTIGGS